MQRTGFRSTWTPPPKARDMPPPAVETLRATRGCTYSGTTSGKPVEKEDASQSSSYMRAARALGYCMRCGRTCRPEFCHADLDKGQGLKTDVRRGWPGCRDCHETVGRKLAKALRRAVEYLLGVMTRAAIEEANSWPKNLARWDR